VRVRRKWTSISQVYDNAPIRRAINVFVTVRTITRRISCFVLQTDIVVSYDFLCAAVPQNVFFLLLNFICLPLLLVNKINLGRSQVSLTDDIKIKKTTVTKTNVMSKIFVNSCRDRKISPINGDTTTDTITFTVQVLLFDFNTCVFTVQFFLRLIERFLSFKQKKTKIITYRFVSHGWGGGVRCSLAAVAGSVVR